MEINKLKEAGRLIREGKIVVFPTETVYGIGTNGLNSESVNRLYEIKKRPRNKPISLLVSNMDMVKMVAKDISNIEYKIMENFFPGPLTIILKKSDLIPDVVTSGLDYVGVRMPKGEIAGKIVDFAGIPVATPSANISGEPSGTEITEIKKHFENNVDLYIDGGISEIGYGSTIVKVIDDKPVILRQGIITLDDINKIL